LYTEMEEKKEGGKEEERRGWERDVFQSNEERGDPTLFGNRRTNALLVTF